MRRSLLSFLALITFVAGVIAAQQVQPSSGPAAAANIVAPPFDVISVKPASKDSPGTRMQFTPDGLHGSGVTVRFLLFEGFGGINQNQVVNEPTWSTEGFDIEAKVAPADVAALGKMNFDQRRQMFQAILTERFKLVVHHETRELPLYVLTVAKGGAKFKASAPDDPTSTTPHRRGMMVNNGKITATDAQISTMITILSRNLGRTIVDKTGLMGNYDFTLEWADDAGSPRPSDGSAATAAGAPDPGASIFTALQEQLGLKLESTKGPVDVVVIDHIEKPMEN